jgi:sugar phosphate isomerase/epimerase
MNRRELLATLAALPALGTPGSAQAPTTTARPDALKLGTVTYNIANDWDIPTIITNLTEVGMEAVELRTTHAHGVEISLSPQARAEVRKRFEDSPVRIGGLGTICEYHAADPAVVRQNIEDTKAWVELARDVGSPGVKVRPNGVPKGVSEEKTFEQIGKALAECGAAAEDHGVKIQLEVHGAQTSRLPAIRAMLDHAGNHPGVMVCWNSNQTDLVDGGFQPAFDLVKHQIGQVHMRDLFLEEYPWPTLITQLAAMRFDGYFFAEIPESADPVRILKYYRALFRAYESGVRS